ncbi:MAG: 5-(carboxyamino)imidazole ribonucleotide synthase [Flavobacteriales bacterium]|nr:5-(carboxyamino)imidazole ribonucleotide synthase [Flavobacteriales bacterium]
MATVPVIALLGGGQLGRMFIENALRYGHVVHVLDPDPKAPCAGIAHRFVVGDLTDRETVVRFGAAADIIGIEIEQVNVDGLEDLKQLGKRVVPAPHVLRTIQDKGLQKQFYVQHGIPTAPFALVNGIEEIRAASRLLPAFLKTRTGGYDGKGVMRVDDPASTDLFEGPCMLEQCVDIALELAVLVVRDDNGVQVTYDSVEMVFDPVLNLVDHLQAPARIPAETAAHARALADRVANAFGEPGLYAVEMFLTRSGELLVNETAPRAHNSGHHTIEACASSQFDQLLRCYMQWPLGDTRLRSLAAMVNLVGSGGTGQPMLMGAEEVLALPGTFPHLYGKAETRSGRKMGHVTVMAQDQQTLELAIHTVREQCRVVPATTSAHAK